MIDIGTLANHPNLIQKPNSVVTVSTLTQWNTLDSGITDLTVMNNSLNDASLNVLDLTRFKRLKRIVIGDECFMNVIEVIMTWLYSLESVEIGMNSFTQHKDDYGNDPIGHFYLKDCPKLKSLRVGMHSFSDYSVIEIENVDALEVIEIGSLNEYSYNFIYASLELRSILIHSE